jgi:exodeoxyribonuclease VII large subunit
VSPDHGELCERMRQVFMRLSRTVHRGLANRMQRVDYLSRCLVHPGDRVRHQLQHVAHLGNRMCSAWRRHSPAARVQALEMHLKHLNPELVLERGYAIAETEAGAIVRNAAEIAAGDALKLKFARGGAQVEVRKPLLD